jgi:uncharacterized protein
MTLTRLAIIAIASVTFADANASDGPSFKCSGKLSQAERLICEDAELSRLDRELFEYYKLALKTVEQMDASHAGDKSADYKGTSTWFKRDLKEEWTWREKNCRNIACLERWYWKRTALLRWLATAEDALFSNGVKEVRQLASGDTLISYQMSTHVRSFVYRVSSADYRTMMDGDVRIISERPLIYEAKWQKGYFSAGGAFWFNTIRDDHDRVIAISPAEAGDNECMSREEFMARTTYYSNWLALVTIDQICVTR